MLGDIKLGFILLISNYLSPIIVGILTINRSKISSNSKELPKNDTNTNFGSALKSALDNGINTTLQVGAFVVLFSIIVSIIKNNAYISIAFNNIEAFLNLPKYSIYGLFLGSVEFTNGCKLIAKYSFMKFIQGIISFGITFIISSVFSLQYTAYTSSATVDNYNISILITLFIAFLLIGTLIIAFFRKLHRS